MKEYRWAVIGTGYIAGELAKGMRAADHSTICAVLAHSEQHGKRYAETYGVPKVYTDFDRMISEEKPDVIYVAVPNDCHYGYIMKALDCGIPVLSEKPIADNRKQLDALREKAVEKHLFLMEGMWTRCFPAVRIARKWIADGLIGKPLTVNSFFDIAPDPSDWQVWKAGIRHAGGSLRDVGIYSLAMANMVFPGKPEKYLASMHFNGEVDQACRLLLDYGEGRTAVVGGAFNQVGNGRTEILGDKGTIVIGPEFWHPTTAELICIDGRRKKYVDEYRETGFQYEINAVREALEAGRKECPYYTWSESMLVADLIEQVRKEWGVYYTADQK